MPAPIEEARSRIGSPDGRRIVAMLHRRARRAAEEQAEALRLGHPETIKAMATASWISANNCAEIGKRMLYGIDP